MNRFQATMKALVLATAALTASAGAALASPHVYSLSQNFGRKNDTITIRGTGFDDGIGAPVVYFGADAGGITDWNDTTITVTVPKNGAGAIVVSNNDGDTPELLGTGQMGDPVDFLHAEKDFYAESIDGSITIIGSDDDGDPSTCEWGDDLDFSITVDFRLNRKKVGWESWGDYNGGKPVEIYLLGPDLDPSPDAEARWEGVVGQLRGQYPATISNVEQVNKDDHRLTITASPAALLRVAPNAGADGRWGWDTASGVRDDIPFTPGDWSIVAIRFVESLRYDRKKGNPKNDVPLDDVLAGLDVPTWTGRRLALDSPLTVFVNHPLDLRTSTDGGAAWDSLQDDFSGNGNDRLLPGPPYAQVPRVWFSHPIPEVIPDASSDVGLQPTEPGSLWPGYRVVVENRSHLRLPRVVLDVPFFSVTPLGPVPARFHDLYPNGSVPSIPGNALRGSLARYDGDAFGNATTTGVWLDVTGDSAVAELIGLHLVVPRHQACIASLDVDGTSYSAIYATANPFDPNPSDGIPGDYEADERLRDDPYLVKIFVNADGNTNYSRTSARCNLADLSANGYFNSDYDENIDPDPFGFLYEEAYRSFVLAASVTVSHDFRVAHNTR